MGHAAIPDGLNVLAGRWARAILFTVSSMSTRQAQISSESLRQHVVFLKGIMPNHPDTVGLNHPKGGRAFHISAFKFVIKGFFLGLYSPNNLLTLLKTLSFSGS